MRPPEGSLFVKFRNAMRAVGSIASVFALSLSVAAVACGKEATSGVNAPQTGARVDRTGKADRPLVAFLGDSLTAGYGLPEKESFPARVAALLEDEGHAVRVVNAGVSGDTTAGGLTRLDWLLRQKPAVLVVGLGANDGLRGLAPEETARNLHQIVARARAAGVRVLLLGMKLPRNYGGDYFREFEAVYPDLSRELKVPLVPFLLEGVAGDPNLNLADGIHPNPVGQERVARTVLPYLRSLLDR